MKLKQVVIEGFHNVEKKTYDFDNITYFHGRNGVGKSTVLQAVQLGLLGYVPGSNKTKQGVFAHSNNHTMAVKVIMEDDNGQKCSIQRVWTKAKSTVSESIDLVPPTLDIKNLVDELELPLFNFDDFTHMTANTLKDWFINYLPKSSFTTNWPQQLKGSTAELPANSVDAQLIQDSVKAIQAFGLEGVEEIRSANTYFKNQLSFMKQELTRKTGTIQSLIHYDDYNPTYSEDELKQMISATENQIVRASVAAQEAKRWQSTWQEMQGLKDAKATLDIQKKKLASLESEYNILISEIQEKDMKYRDLWNEITSYQTIINSEGLCVFTKKKCDEISSLRDEYICKQNEAKTASAALLNELTEAQTRKSILDEQIRSLKNSILMLTNDARRYEILEQQWNNRPEESTPVDTDELRANLEKYNEDYGKAVANRQYNELSQVVIQDKYRIENAIECLKIWVKLTDVNGLQASGGGTNPFDGLADSVNLTLKKLFTSNNAQVAFNSEGKANSFSFGIDRDGVYVPFNLLSSGEKCMFILSMFIGLLEYTHSPLKLILIDDFLDHLDDENFRAIFEALQSKTDIQYIFAGVKPVDSEICKVVEL